MPIYRVPLVAFAFLVWIGLVTYKLLSGPGARDYPAIRRFWLLYAAGQTMLAGVVFYSHLAFPLNLEFMESAVLQHVLRLSEGKAIYVDPSPEFVALAYNPLFYLISVPFVRLFGPELSSIRLPAILGAIGCAGLVWAFIFRFTRSKWWALVGVGVFASAYRAMDCYLDIGHRDSLLLLSILAGFWFLNRGGRFGPLLGLLALAAGFWFKQTGIYFLAMGIVYALWQYPWSRALLAALAGVAVGPLLHALAPDSWFGARMHYFTFEVPASWTDLHANEASNFVRLLIWHYGPLALTAGWLWVRGWRKPNGRLGILRIAIPGAIASGAAVMLSPGSNNNVYIPMGGLLIVAGVIGLALLSRAGMRGRRLSYSLLALVFALLLYRPQTVLRLHSAPAYAEFTSLLRSLDGPVYAPGLGPLFAPPGQPEVHLSPLVHVVPLADMVRGRGRDETSSPIVRNLLRSVETPATRVAYILTHSPLEDEPTLAYLGSRYRLEKDFGQRFEALATLPARHGHLYPRYLYRLITPVAHGGADE
jgi:hypothetical protein